MADTDAAGSEAAPKRKSALVPLLLGLILSLCLGGGGFYAAYSGLVLGLDTPAQNGERIAVELADPLPPVAFVPIEPMLVTVGDAGSLRHLRFEAQLEVLPGAEAEVAALMPRILDVLNSYLRAVDVTQLEQSTALYKLRAQMLRRVQLVVDERRVKDLLVTEFVLNQR